ncbi:MAG: PHP domain-containing protein [Nitrospirales bacterium]|nr:PHP domain-containing protein [Nitrospirales bacterium]
MSCKIDLHIHTRFSGDNDADPEEIVEQAILRGLDGIAFTEHYSYEASEHAEGLKEKYAGRIMIFRGVEFSSAEGHCLVFGVDTDPLLLKYAPVEELCRIVNDAGGVIIPSHPYRGSNSLKDLILRLNGFCAIEGFNGCTMRILNEKAIETARSLNIPFTGGSDAHSPAEIGSCYTEFQESAHEVTLVSLLRAGNYRGVDTRKVSRTTFFPFS